MEEKTLVIKANKLIEAKYNLNLNEQKVILYAVSKLDRNKNKFNILELNIREFTKLIDTSPERYSEIRELVRELRRKEVIIKLDKDGKELITGWLSSIEYKGEGRIELEFSEKLIPYLLQLKERFTRYELQNILYLKNKYSIRIYELLKQYESIGSREFELLELKKILGIENEYDRIYDFERFVLKSAKVEINKHTDLIINYKKIKEGRRVAKIKFIIEGKIDKEKALVDALYDKKEIEEIKRKCGLNGTNFNSKQIMELYEIAVKKTESADIDPHEYIKLNYNNMINNNTARNKFAWLKKALENDYANASIQIKMNYNIG